GGGEEARRHWRRVDGQRHRACRGPLRRAGGAGRREPGGARACAGDHRQEPRPPGLEGRHSGRGQGGGAGTHRRRHRLCRLRRLRPRHRGGDRERGDQEEDFFQCLSDPAAGRDPRLQHLLHPHHALGRRDGPAWPLRRHAFLQPGADDEAGRGHPRPRHRGCDRRGRHGARRADGQDGGGGGRLSGLRRQPHPLPDAERGDLRADGGRRRRGGDRCRHEARRQPPDGPARAQRLRRPRHALQRAQGAARGPGRPEVPALPAARQICRGRLAWPQVGPRLLRLLDHAADADAV
ncbi:MAG: 3-hydroxybutyryl-CoA dehydrogenase, partial [uncultured Craurococcus sp.]